MKTLIATLAVMVVFGGAGGHVGHAQTAAEQEKQQDLKQAEARALAARKQAEADQAQEEARVRELQRLIPLSVDVTVSRYQGDRKVSSLPYALAVNANKLGNAGKAQLRMGSSVPVATTGFSGPPGQAQLSAINYRDVGTSIDCSATAQGDGGFQIQISVEDTSVYTNSQDATAPTVADRPVFRTFKSTSTLVMKDGQSREFTAATDRVSGEVVRVTVTLKVVK